MSLVDSRDYDQVEFTCYKKSEFVRFLARLEEYVQQYTDTETLKMTQKSSTWCVLSCGSGFSDVEKSKLISFAKGNRFLEDTRYSPNILRWQWSDL